MTEIGVRALLLTHAASLQILLGENAPFARLANPVALDAAQMLQPLVDTSFARLDGFLDGPTHGSIVSPISTRTHYHLAVRA